MIFGHRTHLQPSSLLRRHLCPAAIRPELDEDMKALDAAKKEALAKDKAYKRALASAPDAQGNGVVFGIAGGAVCAGAALLGGAVTAGSAGAGIGAGAWVAATGCAMGGSLAAIGASTYGETDVKFEKEDVLTAISAGNDAVQVVQDCLDGYSEPVSYPDTSFALPE